MAVQPRDLRGGARQVRSVCSSLAPAKQKSHIMFGELQGVIYIVTQLASGGVGESTLFVFVKCRFRGYQN